MPILDFQFGLPGLQKQVEDFFFKGLPLCIAFYHRIELKIRQIIEELNTEISTIISEYNSEFTQYANSLDW